MSKQHQASKSKIKMRPVTTAQSMRRSYNPVIDEETGQNPFKSMYSQAFGGKDAEKSKQQNRFATPQKEVTMKKTLMNGRDHQQRSSANDPKATRNYKQVSSKFDTAADKKQTVQPSSHRKYGEYQKPTLTNSPEMKGPKQRKSTSAVNNTIGGYPGGRKTRCTDKFVRYPYPKCLVSGYQKDFKDKLKNTIVVKKGEAFNLEKEAKIINPHRMDLGTTTKDTFKDFKVEPKQREIRRAPNDHKPIIAQSSYQQSFPNWRNGKHDVFHEKQPQYPFYSLPFRGESNYQQQFTEEQQRKLKEHNAMLKKIGQKGSASMIGLNQYRPQKFESQTTNQKAYQGFKLQARPKVQTQKVNATMSKAMPTHFETYNKRDFIEHNLKVCELDQIPYP